MYRRLLALVLFIELLHTLARASGVPTILFIDGLWKGGIETSSNISSVEECWASTTFSDSTTFTLSKRGNGIWHLRLSNPNWRLLASRRYDMTVLVDFYPQLHITAEAKSQTRLEIANLDDISLLGLIENGHTINLTSDGFNEKYNLEGSAKVIERVRNCFVDHLAGEKPAIIFGPR